MSVLPVVKDQRHNLGRAKAPSTRQTRMSVLPTDTEHEKQKAQRGTRVETIGRLGGAAAAPVGVRPRGVFSSAAAQPAGGEAGASLFHSVARSRRMRFRLCGTQGGAAPDWQRRSAPGRTEQSGSRGQSALARRDSLLGSG